MHVFAYLLLRETDNKKKQSDTHREIYSCTKPNQNGFPNHQAKLLDGIVIEVSVFEVDEQVQ